MISVFMNDAVHNKPCSFHYQGFKWTPINDHPCICALCGIRDVANMKNMNACMLSRTFHEATQICHFQVEIVRKNVTRVQQGTKEQWLPERFNYNSLELPLPCPKCFRVMQDFVASLVPAVPLLTIPFIPCKDLHRIISEYAFHWHRECILCD